MRTLNLYILFAVIATIVNLLTQEITLGIFPMNGILYSSILAGTISGLLTKYILDKKYIFKSRATGLKNHSRLLALYTATGIVTTFIFWTTELGFEHAFGGKQMRYIGAIIGLSIGYASKFYLDRKYVFNTPRHK